MSPGPDRWRNGPAPAPDSSTSDQREPGSNESRLFWDRAAQTDPMWHIATGASADSRTFFESGRRETDVFLAHTGLRPDPTGCVLEIGCGIGRMTARLSELYGSVIALDVSSQMLARARVELADRHNISYLLGSGADLVGIGNQSVDVVFSYIVLQHVPTAAGQLEYLREVRRVLKPGGVGAIQVRSTTVVARCLDWIGHLRHRVAGRRTLDRAWRGTRVSRAALVAAATGCPAVASKPRGGAHGEASVELRPFGRRHLWVVMHRTVG